MAAIVAWVTIAVCMLASLGEAILCYTSSTRLAPGDVLILLFFIAPYGLLCLLSRWQRHNTVASSFLLAVAVALATWGLYVYGVDSYRYHTEPHFRQVQRYDVFIVPLFQWAAVLVVAIVLFLAWVIRRLVTWWARRRRCLS